MERNSQSYKNEMSNDIGSNLFCENYSDICLPIEEWKLVIPLIIETRRMSHSYWLLEVGLPVR